MQTMVRIPSPSRVLGRAGGARYTSLVEHPLAPQLKPWLRTSSRGSAKRTSWRIEIKKMPDALLEQAQQIEIECQHCHFRKYAPFRQRVTIKADGERKYTKINYVAMACSPDVSKGCSKGDAATAEAEKIVEWLRS